MAGSLGEAQLQLTVDNKALEVGLNKARKDVEGFSASAANGFQRANQATLGLSTAIAGIAGTLAVGSLFKKAIDEAVQLETITRRLSNTLGKEGAGQAMSFTKGLADQLGLSFKDLAGAFASFTAAASGAGVPLQQQKDLFAAVSKAGQSLGLTSYEISGSLLALQQVAAKGTVQMEELRGQLGERLPIAFAAAAKGLKLTQQELIKLVESGQLSASQFFPALTKGLNEMTAGAGGAETAAQNFQKLQNAWDELMASFGQSLLPIVTEQVKNLSVAIEGLGRKFEADKLGFGTGGAGLLGILSDQAINATESLKLMGREAGLTSKEMRALWYDALKAEGIKNPAFANDQAIQRVLDKTKELAAARSKGNTDINKEAAEAQRLLSIAAARSEAEQKVLAPAKERLRTAQALAGLDGPARQVAEAQLAIDVARAKYAKLRADADKASAQPGNEAGAAKLQAAAQAAAADLSGAMITSGEAMKAAARDAADQLKSASDQLKGTLRSNLDLLNSSTRSKVIEEARASLGKSLATGRYDAQAVNAGIKTNQDLLDMASKLESINSSFNAYEKAQAQVARTQEQLGVSFTDLGVKLDQTASEMAALAKKDWNVYVNGQNVSGYGDMVAAMNRGL